MQKKQLSPEDTAPTKLTITLKNHIIRDLQVMEKNTKISVDELVSTALSMFIATHNDYLGRNRLNQ